MNFTAFSFLILYCTISLCAASIYITTCPDSIKFKSDGEQQNTLRRREIPGVINFLMSLPAEHLHKTESWKGVKSMNIFDPPRANLLITVHLPREKNFVLPKFVAKYPTDGLESSIPPVFELNSALFEKYGDRDVVKCFVLENQFKQESGESIDTERIRELLNGDESILRVLPFGSVKSLDPSNADDVQFFGELQMMKDALDNVHDSSKQQSFHVMLTSVERLVRAYGADSVQVTEAITLLQFYIPNFIDKMADLFHGHLLSEVEITEATPNIPDYLIRHSRSLLQVDDTPSNAGPNITSINLATPNTAEQAVIISIVFWLMLFFFLAVLAVSYSMWFMDPGKDNIIYRVTGQRIKMD